MTIYTLYVKTHNKTGLKYLGQTTKEPYSYKGSGIDWKKHLQEHGADHTTDIVKICKTKSELNYWGRYYSALFNVVGSMDDFGNKIWANRIPETGGGEGGRAHYLYDKTIHTFENMTNGNKVTMTQNEFCSTYHLNKGNVCLMIKGQRNHVREWKMSESNYKMPTQKIYVFEHHQTGEQISMTVVQFCKKFSVRCKTSVYELTKTTFNTKKVKGWKIIYSINH